MDARARLRIYIVFADALMQSEPYDVGGAFALLQDVEEALGPRVPRTIDVAIRAQLTAALSQTGPSFAVARYSLVRVMDELERRLAGTAV